MLKCHRIDVIVQKQYCHALSLCSIQSQCTLEILWIDMMLDFFSVTFENYDI